MRMPLLALIVPALCLAQTPARPRMTLDALQHDFGKVPGASVVSHRFKVTNAGDAPLTISRLNPSCGCTSTVVGRETLAPGESTELEVTFNSAGALGPVLKSVQVVSDDPELPIRTLTFTADVLPEVKASPEEVRFEDLERGSRPQASVKVASGTGRPIQLGDVRLSEAPWLGVTTRMENKDLWVDFDLLASRLPQDKLSGTDTVTLQLANPNHSEVKLSVHWELRAPVTATPARVAWSEPAGQDLRASVQLASRDHKPFRILSARTSNPLLMVSGLSPRAAVSQGVQLRLSPAAAPGTYEEKAFLTLDSPGHPEFEIRVAASLR
jgi:hypothetical protein